MGMMEKNIVTVVFVALLILSAVFATGAIAGGVFSDIFDAINAWFKQSPIGDLFYVPIKRTERVFVIFYPDRFTLLPEDEVNVSYGDVVIYGFEGEIYVDYGKNKTIFSYKTGKPVITSIPSNGRIDHFSMGKISIKNMRIEVTKDGWNETSANGSVEIINFLGRVEFTENSIKLEGNATRFIKA